MALLELLGHRGRALGALGLAAAAVETATGAWIEAQGEPALEPLKKGKSGTLVRAGGVRVAVFRVLSLDRARTA